MKREQQNNNDPDKVIVQHKSFEVVEDVEDPPPPHFISEFATLQEWLLNICEQDRPQKSISKYKVGLFESPDDCTLDLVGLNSYHEKDRSVTRIEFEPTNMYFRLPESYYQNLSRQQLLDKLTLDLKDFANTEKFKTSFFAEATIFVFETNGLTIWSNEYRR